MKLQGPGSLESDKIALGETRAQSAGEQNAGFAENVGKFMYEHPYMTAAAGAVAAVGVLALTKGKMAATSADVLAPVARQTLPELDVLGQAGRVLSAQKAPLAVLSKGALPETGQVVARRAVGFASAAGESPMTAMAMKSTDIGANVVKSRQFGFAALDEAPINSMVGSVQTLGSAAQFEGAASPVAVYINSGERAFVNMNKAGPVQYAKIDRTRLLANKPDDFYKQEYVLSGGDPSKYDHMVYYASRPEVKRASDFYHKIGGINRTEDLALYPFRVSPEVKSPTAVMNHEGHVTSLLFPPGISKTQLSESMAAVSIAQRAMIYEPALNACYIVQKSAPGFVPRMVQVHAESMQDMMTHAIKGSSEWISGARGNTLTQYLRDWYGNFTRNDRIMLHKLFTGEKLRILEIPRELHHLL